MNDVASMAAMTWGNANCECVRDPEEFGRKVKQVYLACGGSPDPKSTELSSTAFETLLEISSEVSNLRSILLAGPKSAEPPQPVQPAPSTDCAPASGLSQ